MLIRLDDVEARTRLAAADAEASARKRERDAQPGTAGREDVRKAEDAVFAAERAVMNARFELDDAIAGDRKAPAPHHCRRRPASASTTPVSVCASEQASFALAQAKGNIPGPNRLEAGVSPPMRM